MSEQSPPARRKRLPRDDRIARIIAVARELLGEKGYDKVLTADIAARCGVSEAAIYKYFPTKRDLLISVVVHWYEELLAEDSLSTDGMSAYEALRHVIWRHFSIVKRDPEVTRLILLDLRPDPTYRSMPVFQLNRKLVAQIPKMLKVYMDSGHLRNDIPIAIVRDMIFGAIEHQTWAFLRREGDFSVEESTNGIAKALFEGLRPTHAIAQKPDALMKAVQRLERISERLETQVSRKR